LFHAHLLCPSIDLTPAIGIGRVKPKAVFIAENLNYSLDFLKAAQYIPSASMALLANKPGNWIEYSSSWKRRDCCDCMLGLYYKGLSLRFIEYIAFYNAIVMIANRLRSPPWLLTTAA